MRCISDTWPARTHFSEMLRAAIKKGPHLITRRGAEVGVLVSVEKLTRLQESAGPGCKPVLARALEPRVENFLPKHGRLRRR